MYRQKEYIRMFEDESCDEIEKRLTADIFGKSVDRCQKEWYKQYVLDIIFDDNTLIVSLDTDSNKQVEIVVALQYVYPKLAETLCKYQDDCITIEALPIEFYNGIAQSTNYRFVIKFIDGYLTIDEFNKIYDKILTYRNL